MGVVKLEILGNDCLEIEQGPMMDKFIGETILVEGGKHVVVVPVEYLTDRTLPLGSRILFTKTSKSVIQVEVNRHNENHGAYFDLIDFCD